MFKRKKQPAPQTRPPPLPPPPPNVVHRKGIPKLTVSECLQQAQGALQKLRTINPGDLQAFPLLNEIQRLGTCQILDLEDEFRELADVVVSRADAASKPEPRQASPANLNSGAGGRSSMPPSLLPPSNSGRVQQAVALFSRQEGFTTGNQAAGPRRVQTTYQQQRQQHQQQQQQYTQQQQQQTVEHVHPQAVSSAASTPARSDSSFMYLTDEEREMLAQKQQALLQKHFTFLAQQREAAAQGHGAAAQSTVMVSAQQIGPAGLQLQQQQQQQHGVFVHQQHTQTSLYHDPGHRALPSEVMAQTGAADAMQSPGWSTNSAQGSTTAHGQRQRGIFSEQGMDAAGQQAAHEQDQAIGGGDNEDDLFSGLEVVATDEQQLLPPQQQQGGVAPFEQGNAPTSNGMPGQSSQLQQRMPLQERPQDQGIPEQIQYQHYPVQQAAQPLQPQAQAPLRQQSASVQGYYQHNAHAAAGMRPNVAGVLASPSWRGVPVGGVPGQLSPFSQATADAAPGPGAAPLSPVSIASEATGSVSYPARKKTTHVKLGYGIGEEANSQVAQQQAGPVITVATHTGPREWAGSIAAEASGASGSAAAGARVAAEGFQQQQQHAQTVGYPQQGEPVMHQAAWSQEQQLQQQAVLPQRLASRVEFGLQQQQQHLSRPATPGYVHHSSASAAASEQGMAVAVAPPEATQYGQQYGQHYKHLLPFQQQYLVQQQQQEQEYYAQQQEQREQRLQQQEQQQLFLQQQYLQQQQEQQQQQPPSPHRAPHTDTVRYPHVKPQDPAQQLPHQQPQTSAYPVPETSAGRYPQTLLAESAHAQAHQLLLQQQRQQILQREMQPAPHVQRVHDLVPPWPRPDPETRWLAQAEDEAPAQAYIPAALEEEPRTQAQPSSFISAFLQQAQIASERGGALAGGSMLRSTAAVAAAALSPVVPAAANPLATGSVSTPVRVANTAVALQQPQYISLADASADTPVATGTPAAAANMAPAPSLPTSVGALRTRSRGGGGGGFSSGGLGPDPASSLPALSSLPSLDDLESYLNNITGPVDACRSAAEQRAREMVSALAAALCQAQKVEASLQQQRRAMKAALAGVMASITQLESDQAIAVEGEDFDTAAALDEQLTQLSYRRANMDDQVRLLADGLQRAATLRLQVLGRQVEVWRITGAYLARLQSGQQQMAATLASQADREAQAAAMLHRAAQEALVQRRAALEERTAELDAASAEVASQVAAATAPAEAERQRRANTRDALQAEVESLRALLTAKEAALATAEAAVAEAVDVVRQQAAAFDADLARLEEARRQLETEAAQVASHEQALQDSERQAEARAAAVEEHQSQLRLQADALGTAAEAMRSEEEALAQRVAAEARSQEQRERLLQADEKAREDLKGLEKCISDLSADLSRLAEQRGRLAGERTAAQESLAGLQRALPELEAAKRAAAANKDFREAARLSGELRALSAQADVAAAQLARVSSAMTELAAVEGSKVSELEELRAMVHEAQRNAAEAHHRYLVFSLGLSRAALEAAAGAELYEEAGALQVEVAAEEAEVLTLERTWGFTRPQPPAATARRRTSVEASAGASMAAASSAGAAAATHLAPYSQPQGQFSRQSFSTLSAQSSRSLSSQLPAVAGPGPRPPIPAPAGSGGNPGLLNPGAMSPTVPAATLQRPQYHLHAQLHTPPQPNSFPPHVQQHPQPQSQLQLQQLPGSSWAKRSGSGNGGDDGCTSGSELMAVAGALPSPPVSHVPVSPLKCVAPPLPLPPPVTTPPPGVPASMHPLYGATPAVPDPRVVTTGASPVYDNVYGAASSYGTGSPSSLDGEPPVPAPLPPSPLRPSYIPPVHVTAVQPAELGAGYDDNDRKLHAEETTQRGTAAEASSLSAANGPAQSHQPAGVTAVQSSVASSAAAAATITARERSGLEATQPCAVAAAEAAPVSAIAPLGPADPHGRGDAQEWSQGIADTAGDDDTEAGGVAAADGDAATEAARRVKQQYGGETGPRHGGPQEEVASSSSTCSRGGADASAPTPTQSVEAAVTKSDGGGEASSAAPSQAQGLATRPAAAAASAPAAAAAAPGQEKSEVE
ncbi:hypothetical protein VOLCADRAFT_98619 [Volvox carteri f. nagariensis]|uniref:Uncharacterized protein n=1 Tax=Volvox carteri f. nagariensis TaxID=3068 RepID=D8UFU4_VOLCA|nr:uncharacterized protein VOLCADRAFT_98619 [Volvox carteri f. nagariensis]EFJ41441.1 hypothetical protein VOLCADRAFT_98619 [Volvox carteri f. nagariensis]|eukprot:XP_002957547.1 hypothetical protein VOLCADRAFT_98619 [Volvox carteri f. nagariensis]